MADELQRLHTIERVEAEGLGEGEIRAVVATDGEASDGHIIVPRGIQHNGKVPMEFQHHASTLIPALGRWTDFAVRGDSELVATGKFNLTGDNLLSSIRAGVWDLVREGDLDSVSIRGPIMEHQPRRGLPEGHPHRAESGLLIEKLRLAEVSIVDSPADQGAKVFASRADKVGGIEATFWRQLSRSLSDGEPGDAVVRAFASIAEHLDVLRDEGFGDADIANMIAADCSASGLVRVGYGDGHSCMIPREAWDELRGESLQEWRDTFALYREAISREVEIPPETPLPPNGERQETPEEGITREELQEVLAKHRAQTVRDSVAAALGRIQT